MVDFVRILYAECVLAERLVRAKADVAGRKDAFLGSNTISLWKPSPMAIIRLGNTPLWLKQLHHRVALRDNLKGNLNITIGVDSAMLITSRSASSMKITLCAVAIHAANALEDACTACR